MTVNKIKNTKPKVIFIILFLFFAAGFFNISNFLLKAKIAYAQDQYGDLFEGFEEVANIETGEISVVAKGTETKIEEGTGETEKGFLNKMSRTVWEWTKKQAYGKAFKAALKSFLGRLAADTATYLATGEKGQKPMFYTEGWGEYLKNAADNAAGTFIESLGSGYSETDRDDCREQCLFYEENPEIYSCLEKCDEFQSPIMFNLCSPSSDVMLKISLGLKQQYRPTKRPACTFSQMVRNWDRSLQDRDFLKKFQDMFNPWSSDIGVALTLQGEFLRHINKEAQEAVKEREEGKGFKAVKDEISEAIKTPASLVEKSGAMALEQSLTGDTVFTGSIADAIDVFINTLIGKLIDKWFKKGLVEGDYGDYGYDWDRLGRYEAGPTSGGIAGAREQFRDLIQPEFGVKGDYNILTELTLCPNPQKAGPTNCVITDKFRQAIAEKKTVAEAIKQGYLNPNGVFGFHADGLEPFFFNEDYPYRSMIILRKYRIIPVGWELAAQYIKDNAATVQSTRNLGELVACFAVDDEYDGYDAAWCRGLVDPSWVLKAPLNYCKKVGPGPQIVSETITGKGKNSKLSILRDENYCADEQTCIKENNDGTCQLYGYCSEERRKWNFNVKSCEPVYNTCETFRATGGQTVSYLKNTLDYATCNAGNAGCKGYCSAYELPTDQFLCDRTPDNKLFFDKDVGACDEKSEGCHGLIRLVPGEGANLLVNSSFEDPLTNAAWNALPPTTSWSVFGTEANEGLTGEKSLSLTGNLNYTIAAGQAGYNIAGESYSLSFYSKNCDASGLFGIYHGLSSATSSLAAADPDSWSFNYISYAYPASANTREINFRILNTGTNCLIDAIKLERGSAATAYSQYGENGAIYQKLQPAYCEGLNPSTPGLEKCATFARRCNSDEVGCDLYTSQTSGFTVPAKISEQDHCPAECVGYNEYLQIETIFDTSRPEYFIPKTAKKCGAAAAGCDEFTNLDKLGQGAEAREYYSALRHCQKPDAGQCAQFYTWEGGAETGYQLRVFNLRQDDFGNPYLTDVGTYRGSTCADASDYNIKTNPMCREFYSRSGVVSYRFYPYAVTCSDNCHPYRRTEKNSVPNLTAAACNPAGLQSLGYANASASQIFWDGSASRCYFCKNGGVWDSQHQACIYMAIPGEGAVCSAGQAGCREYTGSTGANVRLLLRDNFEAMTTDNWFGEGATNVNLSNASLQVGGHSLEVSGGGASAYKAVSGLVREGKSYVLKFLAYSPANNITIHARLVDNETGTSSVFTLSDPVYSGEWKIIELNLYELDHAPGREERLVVWATNNNNNQPSDFFIDDVHLIEITDRYYLIKTALNVPEACYYNTNGVYVGPFTNLGCDKYKDRGNKISYLHNFYRLCLDSAVGCELMIDTKNSAHYGSEIYFDGNDGVCDAGDEKCRIVEADGYIYAAYDKDKKCNEADKGCQLFGAPYSYEGESIFGHTYLSNNPDKYQETLCAPSEENCAQWSAAAGVYYFKDPGDMACEYRTTVGEQGGSLSWLKKKMKRCDNNNSGAIEEGENILCQKDGDCHPGKCITDERNLPCPVDYLKTFGLGGAGRTIVQPTYEVFGGIPGYWAGLCPASESGCSEYIDPVSKFSDNLLFNHNFSQDVDDNDIPDGWNQSVSGTVHTYRQELMLAEKTLYRLSGESRGEYNLIINCGALNSLAVLGSGNNLGVWTDNIDLLVAGGNIIYSLLIYNNSDLEQSCEVTVRRVVDPITPVTDSVEVKKAIIEYNLGQKIDKKSCNGLVDFEKGCVLFNERAQNSANLAALVWDADLTINDGQGAPPRVNNQADTTVDSNALIKVMPDRVCDKWLACRSYSKDAKGNNACYDIGLCSSFNENGECNNFVRKNREDQTYPSLVDVSGIANMSGYNKAGYGANNSLKADLYSFSKMKQIGEFAEVPNGSFEFHTANGNPLGWSVHWQPDGNLTWSDNKFKVINNPIAAQAEKISYTKDGSSFLKYSPSVTSIQSDFIDVEPNREYVLSANLNTQNYHPGTGFLSSGVVMTIRTYDRAGNPVGYGQSPGSGSDISYCMTQHGEQVIPWLTSCGVGWSNGLDWKEGKVRFRLGPDTDKIRLVVSGGLWWGGTFCCDRGGGSGNAPNGICDFTPESTDFLFAPSSNCLVTGITTYYPFDVNASPHWGCENVLIQDAAGSWVVAPLTGEDSPFVYLGDPPSQSTTVCSMAGVWRKGADSFFYDWTLNQNNNIISGNSTSMASLSGTIDPISRVVSIQGTLNSCTYYHNGTVSSDYNRIESGGVITCSCTDATPCVGGPWVMNRLSGQGCVTIVPPPIVPPPTFNRNFLAFQATVQKDSCAGNVYFDSVSLTPVLETKNSVYQLNSAKQSCRLYPQSDSLACDYYEDSGKRQKGWPGYCLEYDRKPGDENTCLLWYPIDRVKNDGMEEGVGYRDRLPLYYCTEIGNTIYTVSHSIPHRACADELGEACTPNSDIGLVFGAESFAASIPSWHRPYLNVNYITSIRTGWGEVLPLPLAANVNNGCGTENRWLYLSGYIGNLFRGFVRADFQSNGDLREVRHLVSDYSSNNCYPGDRTVSIDYRVPHCQRLTQVVTPTGKNKYWSSRAYKGSNYIYNCRDPYGLPAACVYSSDYRPFGAVVSPSPVINPYEWDSKPGEENYGIQPLLFELPDKSLNIPYQPRAGHLQNQNELMRIFAQSYGNWEWIESSPGSGGRYMPSGYPLWMPPTALCNNTGRPPRPRPIQTSLSGTWTKFVKGPDGVPLAGTGDTWTLNQIGNVITGYSASGRTITSGSLAIAGGNITVNMTWSNGEVLSGSVDSGYNYINGIHSNWAAIRGNINEIEEYCAILPRVDNNDIDTDGNNILVNKTPGWAPPLTISKSQFVNLTFNTKIDANQMPLVMIDIDWGDNEQTTITGLEMRARENWTEPHSFYHLYDYWDLKAKNSVNQTPPNSEPPCNDLDNTVYCGNANSPSAMNACNNTVTISPAPSSHYCAVRPGIKIKDNWGWCNNGISGNPCPVGGHANFPNWIVVAER